MDKEILATGVPRRRALVFADGEGFWAFVAKNGSNFEALRALARNHVFEIARGPTSFLIAQGQRPGSVSYNFLGRDSLAERAVLVGPSMFGCGQCHSRSDCPGAANMAPRIKAGEQTIFEVMGDYCQHSFCDCLFLRPSTADEVTLTLGEMRAAGFEPTTSVRAFTDCEFEGEDTSPLVGRNLRSAEACDEAMGGGWYQRVLSSGRRLVRIGYREEMAPARFDDLTFDEHLVESNLIRQRVRALHAGAARSALADYRRRYCRQCVYGCKRLPWRLDDPRPLTVDDVCQQVGEVTDDDRRWLDVLTIAGGRGRFVSEDSGRYRDGVGSRPVRLASGDWGLQIVSLRPPYEKLAVVDVDEYLSTTGRRAGTFESDDDVPTRVTLWAARCLDAIVKSGTAHFHVHRRVHNAVLYLRLRGRELELGSDSWATRHGGWGGRGSTIAPGERPRFTTHYSYPFAADIWRLLSERSCR